MWGFSDIATCSSSKRLPVFVAFFHAEMVRQDLGFDAGLCTDSFPRPDCHADAASGGGNTSRASRRSSSHQQQQQQSCAGAGAGAGATAAAMARNLAAQVSFNHEKRQGWERPVLDDINNRRAGQGLAAVDKLTIQVRRGQWGSLQLRILSAGGGGILA